VDLPPRQRTLRAAIDWSYELLEPGEQILLKRLTVFVGGWTLEAAEAIVGVDGEVDQAGSAEWVLEVLSSLVDKSLVKRQEGRDGQLRFTMLETVCEYATEKLVARGEQARLQRRHAAYYLQLVQAAEPALRGPDQGLWLARLKNEHNNLQVALSWALDSQDAEMALKLSASLWRYWWTHGHYREGRDWLEKALALPGESPPAWRAMALNGLGVLARSQGDFANARVFLEACLEIQRSLEDRAGVSSVLNSLGVLAQYQQDYDQAYRFHEESLAHRRELGSPRDMAVSLNNLAMVAQEKREFDLAEDLYGESLELFRQAGDARSIAAVLANQGSLQNDLGEAEPAAALFKESLLILKELGQRDDIVECLEGFAGVAVLLKQFERGARLLGAAEGLREAIGSPPPPYKLARYRRFKEKIAALLDLNLIAAERAAGKAMPLDAAIEYALLQEDVRDSETKREFS
jgi:hypothetical protein